MIDPSCSLIAHIDVVDERHPAQHWIGLPCPSCHMDEAVLACYHCEKSDPYVACCFNCATLFDLDWDEHGGDTLLPSILNKTEGE